MHARHLGADLNEQPRWVLHTMQRWLPLSEQFVHTLITRSRHPSIVVSRFGPEHQQAFPHDHVRSLRWIPRRLPGAATERRLITAGLLATTARYRPGLVHHHHGYRMRDPAGYAGRRRIPYVVSLHGHDVTTFAHDEPEYFRGAFDAVDAVIVPSSFLADRVVGMGVVADRVHAIPSGVDTGFFRPTPLRDTAPLVVFVGRFVEKKGLDVLLEAWPKVRAAVPDAGLKLVGFGPLEGLAAGGGPGVTVERARVAGRALQVRDALAAARVVVTPSRTASDGDAETLLLVNLEAQAAGRPLVTTRHGGIPEFVDDGRTAIVVPEGDPAALADALLAVLTDDTLAERMALAGPGWAAQFDAGICAGRVDDLYDGLMGAAR